MCQKFEFSPYSYTPTVIYNKLYCDGIFREGSKNQNQQLPGSEDRHWLAVEVWTVEVERFCGYHNSLMNYISLAAGARVTTAEQHPGHVGINSH